MSDMSQSSGFVIHLNGGYALDHCCTYYCQQDLHAITLLTVPGLTVDGVAEEAKALGLSVASVFPARESNLAALHAWPGVGRSWQTGAPKLLSLAERRAHNCAWIILCRNTPMEVNDDN